MNNSISKIQCPNCGRELEIEFILFQYQLRSKIYCQDCIPIILITSPYLKTNKIFRNL